MTQKEDKHCSLGENTMTRTKTTTTATAHATITRTNKIAETPHLLDSEAPKRTPVQRVLSFFYSLLSIRTIFIFILLFFILGIALTVWGLGYQGGKRSVDNLVDKMRQKAAESTVTAIENFFERTEGIASNMASFYWTNAKDLQGVEDDAYIEQSIKTFLYSQLQANKAFVNSLNWIRADGALTAVSYVANRTPSEYSYSFNTQKYGYVKGHMDISNNSLPLIPSTYTVGTFSNMTVSIPTYLVAIKQAPTTGEFFPLSPHAFEPSKSVSSLARPYYMKNGALVGTVNCVFYLDTIKRSVMALNPSKQGFVVVMQDDGVIVGDSTPVYADAKRPCGSNYTLVTHLCHKINSTRLGFSHGITNFPSSVLLETSLGTLHVLKKTVTRGLLNWHVFVALPDDEFTGPVAKFSKTVIWVTAIIIASAMVFGVIVTFTFLRTLSQLSRCFKDIQKLNLDSREIRRAANRTSYVYEIRVLENNFKSMLSTIKSFQKYIPKQIVMDLVKNQKEATLGLETKHCSIFFMDVANFTTISERLEPKDLVNIMCNLFNISSRVIVEHGGVIDKYIGDCLMAFWNAPRPVSHHEYQAITAAIEIQMLLEEHRQLLLNQGFPEIRCRIGMSANIVMVGNFGSDERIQYTTIGDTVNLASRLEGLNKQYGTSIIISEDMYLGAKQCPQWNWLCRRLDTVVVKGKHQGIMVYEVLLYTEDQRNNAHLMLMAYDTAFDEYVNGNFAVAQQGFHSVLVLFGPDPVVEKKISQCNEFIKNPPVNWDGRVYYDEK